MEEVADGVWAVCAGGFPANSYICRADVPGGAILIDAGLDAEPIEVALATLGLRPAHLFCTHGHFDHIGSASHFQQRYGLPVHLHAADLRIARANNFVLMAMKRPERITMPEVTPMTSVASFALGSASLRFRPTPGHTPGSGMFEWGRDLFTGDTLFARGVGLSKLPGEDADQLRRSIEGLWDDLDRFCVHPGHGPSAAGTLVKQENARLRVFLGGSSSILSSSVHD